ncbi:hypothetical protein MSG28_015627 [Choristoneura fumiferana]|uniref:Uncharacterized protein n=1 Tax=Choristoneura fumiferana TaxID=7141 RepID=A0ACC0KAV6_CHOFU|nr:hypothetical protein MSG28_015627 [Choristoneura fumiferana]
MDKSSTIDESTVDTTKPINAPLELLDIKIPNTPDSRFMQIINMQNVRFTALERRHHCRECGAVFCGRCSRYEAPVRRLRALRPVRVCQRCHDAIHAKQ